MGFNVREMIADRIIDTIEKENRLPWVRPWSSNNIALKRTGKPYSFLNQLLLPAGEYISYNQIKKEGGNLKKGAKQYIATFWKQWVSPEEAKTAKEEGREPKAIPLFRYCKVYNVADTTLEPKHYKNEYEGKAEKTDAQKVFTEYIKRHGISFEEEDSSEAYYAPFCDTIHMPLVEQFDTTEGYYGTLFHEAIHSTGHEKRLNRFKIHEFSRSEYSKEELVAEIGACAVLGSLGMEYSEKNSAAYVKAWLAFLKDNKKAIIEASGKAQKAFEMIVG